MSSQVDTVSMDERQFIQLRLEEMTAEQASRIAEYLQLAQGNPQHQISMTSVDFDSMVTRAAEAEGDEKIALLKECITLLASIAFCTAASPNPARRLRASAMVWTAVQLLVKTERWS